MRKLTALLAGITLAMSALPAVAGVVVTQKAHVTNGRNSRDSNQTISVQGNKQKVVDDRTISLQGDKQKEVSEQVLITDLDKGVIYVINPKQKTYFEREFPPKGPMAQTMAASTAAAMNFKKAATSREIAGYKCNDYNGAGHSMAGDFTVTECFSTTAPGAEEFSAFERSVMSKLKSAGAAVPDSGNVPRGMPLALDATTKMGSNVSIPGMSPEQAAKISQMMKNRPPVVTSTVVQKVETQKLASDTFTVPAGFTKEEPPAGPGMGMKMPPGGMKGMKMPPGAMMMAPSAAPSPAAP